MDRKSAPIDGTVPSFPRLSAIAEDRAMTSLLIITAALAMLGAIMVVGSH